MTTNELTQKIEPLKSGDSINIVAKEWFDKVNGNSYFSARIQINGKTVLACPFQYGYGDHYEDIAMNDLFDAGFAPDRIKHENGIVEHLFRYCSRHGITYTRNKEDKQLQRDVKAWGNLTA